MNAYFKLAWMQLKLFGREPVALFFTLAFPLMILLLFGMIFGNAVDPQYGDGYGYIDALVPGLAVIIIGTVALMSIPVATATAREQKILRRYKATPMPPLVYLVADITTNVFIALIGLVILIIAARLVFDLRFGGNWVYVLGGFLLSAFSFAAMGYIVAVLSPTARIAQVVGQVLYFPMMILSGVAFPPDIMPEGVRAAANWLPLTQVVNLLQNLWFGQGWSIQSVLILGLMLVVGTVVSVYTFRWE
ncbi:MAG: ABC transporter permease [Litorilinea sp.]